MILAFKKKKPGRKPKQPWRMPKIPLPEVKDVFLFGGLGAAAYGVYQIYPPSAYILVGGVFVALGLLIYLGGSKHEST